MAGCILETCRRFAADTELEGVGKEKRSLEKGDREGHVQETGRSAIEEDEAKKEKIMMLMKKKKKKKQKQKKKKKKKKKREEEEKEAMNTNLAKNDAIFYTISRGIISMVTTFA
jgi:FKBP-type peptidyl-prolyl cis-trans isomerase